MLLPMPGSFFSFTQVADRAAADLRGEPWPHLQLSVRRHDIRGYSVRGPHEADIGAHHDRANDAVRAIRAYCRRERVTARVNVYDADGNLYTVVEIQRP